MPVRMDALKGYRPPPLAVKAMPDPGLITAFAALLNSPAAHSPPRTPRRCQAIAARR